MEKRFASVVNVRFGDKDAEYSYLYQLPGNDWVVPGDRVVVPSRLKADGSVSMVVGTVAAIYAHKELDPLVEYKPIVQFLDPVDVGNCVSYIRATAEVKE